MLKICRIIVFITFILFSYSSTRCETIIAIGDLHGDLNATKKALRLARLIDINDNWTGSNSIVVQVGDRLDRGNEDRELFDYFVDLSKKALRSGGLIYLITGNHELFNVSLNFKYVTRKGFDDFREFYTEDFKDHPILSPLPVYQRGRAVAFMPGGPYAMMLAKNPSILKLEDTVFVHGGILPEMARYGIDRINVEVSDWISGRVDEMPEYFMEKSGPFLNRDFSLENYDVDCKVLEKSLRIIGASRMVVGHTPQRTGINSACNGKVWRVDTGLSAFYEGSMEVLKIENGHVSILK